MRVFIINQCATNKGDRAVLYMILRELLHNGFNPVTVSTSNPAYWHDALDLPDLDVKFVPWGFGKPRKKDACLLSKIFHRIKFILAKRISFPVIRNAFIKNKKPWYIDLFCDKNYLQAVRDSDVVVSTGGHHITTIIAKSMVTSQLFDMMVALMHRKPLLLWSQTIGSFDFKYAKNKIMVRKILAAAKCIYIRDETSKGQIEKMGVSSNHVHKTFESVFGLYDVVESRLKPSQRKPIMGLSVWTGNKQNPVARKEYISCFSALLSHAVESGYRIHLFPMELAGVDMPYLKDIVKNVNKKDMCEILEHWPSTKEHINLIAQCRIFVGHKTHSQIFSLTAGTPLLAIAYHKKTKDFMAQFGLEQYCIDDSQISKEKLIEKFDKINENLDDIGEKQARIACEKCLQIKKNFTEMVESFTVNKH